MNRVQSVGAVSLVLMMSASVLALAAEPPDATAPAEPEAAPVVQAVDAGELPPGMMTGLVFETDVAGKIVINDSGGFELRLDKTLGARAAVPLLPGEYEITCERRSDHLRARIRLNEGERKIIERADLRPAPQPPVVSQERPPRADQPCRSGWGAQEPRVWRLSLDSGLWLGRGEHEWSSVVDDDTFRIDHGGLVGGMSIGYRLSPEWLVGVSFSNRLIEVSDEDDDLGYDRSRVSTVTTLSLGTRFYLPPLAARSAVKPYLSAGAGPALGIDVESQETWGEHGHDHEHSHVRTEAVMSGQLGAGIDLQPASWLVLGTDVTYQFAPKFSENFGSHRDSSGFTFTFQLGVTFGCRLGSSQR